MGDIKERRIFAFNNFRGLDTENKPVKVAPQRASDGENFIIDSDTLKTRPALVHDEILPFFLASGETIVAWHDYGTMRVYITSAHFYIVDGTTVFNETTTTPNLLYTSVTGTLSFSGKTPVFREEKDALFIFGLGDIFVFSKISSDTGATFCYVLYALNNKPNNPFVSTTEFFTMFDELPKPYEPTIFIDGKQFEDINLLSNVSKYRLFAASKETTGGVTKYELQTNYDEAKHGGFDAEVSFYKDSYADHDRFAVFLGVEGENVSTSELGAAGTLLTTTITVSDTFFPMTDFIYDNATPTPNVLSRIVGLKKSDFFKLKVANTLNTTFEEAMLYIKTMTLSDENKVIKFLLPIRYKKVIKDATTDNVVSSTMTDETIEVFVQLLKYVGTVAEENYEKFSASDLSVAPATTYPTMPTPSGTFQYTGALNSGNYIQYATASVFDTMRSLFSTHIREEINASNISNGDHVKVTAYLYRSFSVVEQAVLDEFDAFQYGTVDNDIEFPDDESYYPAFDYVNTDPVLSVYQDHTPLYLGQTDTVQFWNTTSGKAILRNHILSLIEAKSPLPEATTPSTVILEMHLYANYSTLGGVTYSRGISVGITLTYTSQQTVTKEDHYSIAAVADINFSAVSSVSNAYSLSFNASQNIFELVVQDYFYDYRNEPCIDVKITFGTNPDYALIADSTFGTSFGAENRLFLAGNPNYPHIDRYNISNNLLGDGVDNQSYELSYFPSKNYRVVGGKGAISGYVVATDSQMYITKAKYPNDDALFVRQRFVGDNGLVSYFETRTSARLSPINHRCVARFNNDILVLTDRGLYAVELSSNVLTDERLIKLRSAFVNKQLIADIAAATASDIFIVENNEKMYICVGRNIYHADARYVSSNESNPTANASYEIVKWILPQPLVYGQIIDNEPKFMDITRNAVYKLGFANFDEECLLIPNLINSALISGTYNAFVMTATYDYIAENPEDYVFYIENANKVIGYKTTDFTFTSATRVTVNNPLAFRNLTDGDTVKIMNGAAWETWTISGFEASSRAYFDHETTTANLETGVSAIYKDYSMVPLYVTVVIKDMDNPQDISYRLSPFKPSAVVVVDYLDYNDNGLYSAALESALASDDNNDYMQEAVSQDLFLVKVTPIAMRWISAITDFGNNLMEKTSFKMMLHATKLDIDNTLQFGYRTLRRLATVFGDNTDLSNVFNFENVNLQSFGLATFNSVGMSFPMKENNFLYIQFSVLATGQIELNSIEILYKNNRLLKTVS